MKNKKWILTLLFTVGYLWQAGYLTGDNRLYSPVSARCLGWTVLLGLGTILLLDGLASVFSFLPNWLEDTFDIMQSSWTGILLMAVVGPMVEELFFRGAIERALLRRYKPWVAIVASGLIFGIIHVNPAQVVYASLAGILIPLTLNKLKVDPAISSGVFLIALTDSGGYFIFLGLAKLLLF